jgi:diguanylate cyclase (GGDEF)-like protein
MTLLEELCIEIDNNNQWLVWRLRGEDVAGIPVQVQEYWQAPRPGLRQLLLQSNPPIRITYRGLRRIEELTDVLRADRVLDDFGVLLSVRYLQRDVQDAVRRGADVSVSIILADMDNFGSINKTFGHEAGDVVMKAYLEAVRDVVGNVGSAYRGVGDETTTIILGQRRDRVEEIADMLRERVAALSCEWRGQSLPRVSASIGVATSPPEDRNRDLLNVADQRQKQAKERGKNRVVCA